MPIPTDTLWNVRRLNVVFALSSIVMAATLVWAVVQDYDRAWRPMQQRGRVWEAAMTDEKIDRLNTDDVKDRIRNLDSQIQQKEKELTEKDKEYQQARAAVKAAEERVAYLSFGFNNL